MMTRDSLTAALTGVEGWLEDDEAWSLHRAVATFPGSGPLTVVEIGSWKGRSTIALATGVIAREAAGVVVAVDPHRGGVAHRLTGEEDTFDQFQANLQRAGLSDVVDPIRATSEAARLRFPDDSVHVLFIDGSHRFEDVLDDIDGWAPALRAGARVAFHDSISYPGVAAVVRRRGLSRGSGLRRPRLFGETLFFEHRPAEAWRPADSARALGMRARLGCLRAGRWVRSLARRLRGGRPGTPE
jgi:predicted O-methyltransferase YrrM